MTRRSVQRSTEPATVSRNSEEIEASLPPPPSKFWWDQSKFRKSAKLATSCHIGETLTLLENLTATEKKWFLDHPQFKHLWHLKTRSNMLTGLWLMISRCVQTKKRKEAWFVVNGVPIRYSLREHALITGFSCHRFPANLDKIGSLDMVNRVFGRSTNIRPADIEQKFRSMKGASGGDRLHVAVLLVLVKIICGRKRPDTQVDSTILRLAGDLEECKTFPWGRLSFEDNINNLFHMVGSFKGKLPSFWLFPGFSTPLQLLPYEAISTLKSKFQEAVPEAHIDCPRMCKGEIRFTSVKGVPLTHLYSALGRTEEIQSILDASRIETSNLLRLMGTVVDEDVDDPVVASWVNWLKHQKLCWTELLDKDVAGRQGHLTEPSVLPANDPEVEEAPGSSQPADAPSLFSLMENGFQRINERIDMMESRLKTVELKVNSFMNADAAPADPPGGSQPTAADPPGCSQPAAADPPCSSQPAAADPPEPAHEPAPATSPAPSTDQPASAPATTPAPTRPTSTAASAASGTNSVKRKLMKEKSHKKNSLPKKRQLKESKYQRSPFI